MKRMKFQSTVLNLTGNFLFYLYIFYIILHVRYIHSNKNKKTDPIVFWQTKANVESMPKLSEFAISILEAPATSAPIERIFSRSSNSSRIRRSRLSGTKMASETFLAANCEIVEEMLEN